MPLQESILIVAKTKDGLRSFVVTPDGQRFGSGIPVTYEGGKFIQKGILGREVIQPARFERIVYSPDGKEIGQVHLAPPQGYSTEDFPAANAIVRREDGSWQSARVSIERTDQGMTENRELGYSVIHDEKTGRFYTETISGRGAEVKPNRFFEAEVVEGKLKLNEVGAGGYKHSQTGTESSHGQSAPGQPGQSPSGAAAGSGSRPSGVGSSQTPSVQGISDPRDKYIMPIPGKNGGLPSYFVQGHRFTDIDDARNVADPLYRADLFRNQVGSPNDIPLSLTHNGQRVGQIQAVTGAGGEMLYKVFDKNGKLLTKDPIDLNEAMRYKEGMELTGGTNKRGWKIAEEEKKKSGGDKKYSEKGDPITGAPKKPSIKERIRANPLGLVFLGAGVLSAFHFANQAIQSGASFGSYMGKAWMSGLSLAKGFSDIFGFNFGTSTGLGMGVIVLAYVLKKALRPRRDNPLGGGADPVLIGVQPDRSGSTATASPTSGTQQTSGTPTAAAAYKSWWQNLSSPANTFFILSASALMGVGLNLAHDSSKSVPVKASELKTTRNALQAAVGSGQRLNADPTTVLGKVFIEDSGTPLKPSKVVYVSPVAKCKDDGTCETDYSLNLRTIDHDGIDVSDGRPSENFKPFFMKTARGTIVPVSEAFAGITAQNAMVSLANTPTAQPRDRAAGLHIGAGESHSRLHAGTR